MQPSSRALEGVRLRRSAGHGDPMRRDGGAP
jgi:hypothetical protein